MSENHMSEELRKTIEEAARTSPDMNIPNNDDPADDPTDDNGCGHTSEKPNGPQNAVDA